MPRLVPISYSRFIAAAILLGGSALSSTFVLWLLLVWPVGFLWVLLNPGTMFGAVIAFTYWPLAPKPRRWPRVLRLIAANTLVYNILFGVMLTASSVAGREVADLSVGWFVGLGAVGAISASLTLQWVFCLDQWGRFSDVALGLAGGLALSLGYYFHRIMGSGGVADSIEVAMAGHFLWQMLVGFCLFALIRPRAAAITQLDIPVGIEPEVAKVAAATQPESIETKLNLNQPLSQPNSAFQRPIPVNPQKRVQKQGRKR